LCLKSDRGKNNYFQISLAIAVPKKIEPQPNTIEGETDSPKTIAPQNMGKDKTGNKNPPNLF
jgi:hypothetical protein